MDQEVSQGATLAIVLIALAAVISLAFGIFSIAKGNASEGSADVQQQLDTVSKSVFDSYDQTVITGTQLLSAIKQFQGENVAVCIATNSFQSGTPVYKDHPTPYGVSCADDECPDTGDNWKYINYGSIIAATSDGDIPTKGSVTECLTYNADLGKYIALGWGTKANGVIQTDNMTAGTKRSGNGEYVPGSGKFNAFLITDETGDNIMGVLFRQVPKG